MCNVKVFYFFGCGDEYQVQAVNVILSRDQLVSALIASSGMLDMWIYGNMMYVIRVYSYHYFDGLHVHCKH